MRILIVELFGQSSTKKGIKALHSPAFALSLAGLVASILIISQVRVCNWLRGL
jgi:hypothetical protein